MNKLPLHSRTSLDVERTLLKLRTDAIYLYRCLSLHADFKSGICYPSYRTILNETRISKNKRIHVAIVELQDAGMLETWMVGRRRYYKLLDKVYSGDNKSNDAQSA